MELAYFGQTDVGRKRDNNQDFFGTKQLSDNSILCTVCDGMGGANGGSTASSLAVEIFTAGVQDGIAKCENDVQVLCLMQSALEKANAEIFRKSKEDSSLSGMGTTLVSCLCRNEKYYCIAVGDSRIYAITSKGLKQLSHDHSYVQSLIDSGAITETEAKTHPNRNIITRAVGTSDLIEGDVFSIDEANTDGLLLCSDGLCGYVAHDDMEKICLESKDAEMCAKKLVAKANSESGADNITAVVVRKM